MAAAMLLVLRALAWVPRVRMLINWAMGITIAAGLPWLFLVKEGGVRGFSTGNALLVWIELAAVSVGAILYVYLPWAEFWICASVLSAHTALWAWLGAGMQFYELERLTLLVALCVLWALDIRRPPGGATSVRGSDHGDSDRFGSQSAR